MDLYFQGLASANRGLTPEYMAQASSFFERALALDPGNIQALIGTAMVDLLVGGSFFVDDRAARFAAAETTLIKALSLAPNHTMAHYLLGFVQISTNRAGQGIAECERALALDRNLAGAHAEIGLAKYNIGRAEETEAHIREALRLSPRDTSAYAWKAFAGYAKLYLGSDEEAVAWLHRAIETNRSYSLQHFALACALAHLGQLDDARAAVQAGLALNPTFTLRRFRAGTSSNNPTFLAQRERIYDGMRKAGVPEG